MYSNIRLKKVRHTEEDSGNIQRTYISRTADPYKNSARSRCEDFTGYHPDNFDVDVKVDATTTTRCYEENRGNSAKLLAFNPKKENILFAMEIAMLAGVTMTVYQSKQYWIFYLFFAYFLIRNIEIQMNKK